MPLSAEQRHQRARLAANTRHHPDEPELTADDAADFERRAADRAIDELVARAPKITPEQAARLSRILGYARRASRGRPVNVETRAQGPGLGCGGLPNPAVACIVTADHDHAR